MPTKEDLEQALEIARTEFSQKDPALQARRSGAAYIPPKGRESHPIVEISFLGRRYQIRFPAGEVSFPDLDDEPALWEKILLLHYLNHADGSPLAGQYISFNEIPEGRIYMPAFERRAVHPLLARFGSCPEEILEPVLSLGGFQQDLGDLSVRIFLFAHVPVSLVFWKAQEEFGPRVSVLFDRSITRYLPTEDIIVSTQMMALHLIRRAGQK